MLIAAGGLGGLVPLSPNARGQGKGVGKNRRRAGGFGSVRGG